MKKRLSRKQSAILDELFNSEQNMSEQQILEKHGVKAADYGSWQSEPVFALEFEARMETLGRQSRLLIARYASYAAAKLIALTESSNVETARKACLDIISLLTPADPKAKTETDVSEHKASESAQLPPISPQLAEKILESIAQQDENWEL